MQCPRRPLGRPGVVRHHDNGLAMVRVQRLQEVEDLVTRLAIQVAGRLVAQQQRGVGDDGAGNTDPLFLSAGELPRIVFRPLRQPDHRQRRGHMLLALAARERREQQRQLDVPLGGQDRQQIIELEDKTDMPRAPS